MRSDKKYFNVPTGKLSLAHYIQFYLATSINISTYPSIIHLTIKPVRDKDKIKTGYTNT